MILLQNCHTSLGPLLVKGQLKPNQCSKYKDFHFTSVDRRINMFFGKLFFYVGSAHGKQAADDYDLTKLKISKLTLGLISVTKPHLFHTV